MKLVLLANGGHLIQEMSLNWPLDSLVRKLAELSQGDIENMRDDPT